MMMTPRLTFFLTLDLDEAIKLLNQSLVWVLSKWPLWQEAPLSNISWYISYDLIWINLTLVISFSDCWSMIVQKYQFVQKLQEDNMNIWYQFLTISLTVSDYFQSQFRVLVLIVETLHCERVEFLKDCYFHMILLIA